MFGDYVFRESSAEYNNRILLIDNGDFYEITRYDNTFRTNGFEVIHYTNDLYFRVHYEKKLKSKSGKLLVIANENQYIPFDIRSEMHEYELSMKTLFPRLNAAVLSRRSDLDFDLLCCAYRKNYDDLREPEATEQFIRGEVCNHNNILQLMNSLYEKLRELAENIRDYRKWFRIAEDKARIDVLSAKYHIDFDTSDLNILFCDYALREYGKLSGELNDDTPVLVSRVMEYISERSSRFVIIVMDGMSEFDWRILSESFREITYSKASAFAMIPTVTSVSRQCLLSNKYPRQLRNPWTLTHEKTEFREAAVRLGYEDYQIGYERGWDADFPAHIQCGAVIINDIDDLVHGQTQGRIGMASDVSILAGQDKLVSTVKRFLSKRFDVYITADHGNTIRTGIGRLTGTGLETETKSHCMLVLRDYAEKNRMKSKYDLLEFPKYYLPKKFDYLICKNGDSFDIQGEKVMTHGGISLDECVAPFVKIMAVNYRG